MGIIYNEKAKTFTLHTQNTTYQMQIDAIWIFTAFILWKKDRWSYGLSC